MRSEELIQETKSITHELILSAKKLQAELNEEQLNWKKDEHSWSINQVLAHLNEYANYYHPTFLSKISSTRFTKPSENFISSPLGKSAWSSMKLGNAKNVKRKFKSPKMYNPTSNSTLVTGEDLKTFLEDQRDLLSILDKALNVNLRKVRIPISVSKLIRLRLGDALLFVIYHNERHFQQIQSILHHPNFPEKSE